MLTLNAEKNFAAVHQFPRSGKVPSRAVNLGGWLDSPAFQPSNPRQEFSQHAGKAAFEIGRNLVHNFRHVHNIVNMLRFVNIRKVPARRSTTLNLNYAVAVEITLALEK